MGQKTLPYFCKKLGAVAPSSAKLWGCGHAGFPKKKKIQERVIDITGNGSYSFSSIDNGLATMNVLLASILLFFVSELILVEFILCSKDTGAAHPSTLKIPGLTEVSNSFIDFGTQKIHKTKDETINKWRLMFGRPWKPHRDPAHLEHTRTNAVSWRIGDLGTAPQNYVTCNTLVWEREREKLLRDAAYLTLISKEIISILTNADVVRTQGWADVRRHIFIGLNLWKNRKSKCNQIALKNTAGTISTTRTRFQRNLVLPELSKLRRPLDVQEMYNKSMGWTWPNISRRISTGIFVSCPSFPSTSFEFATFWRFDFFLGRLPCSFELVFPSDEALVDNSRRMDLRVAIEGWDRVRHE